MRGVPDVDYRSLAELEQSSPSLKDGISAEKEASFRKTALLLAREACLKLKLGQWHLNAALTFYYRFYAKRSYKNNDRFYMAVTCIFVAAKVEESPRSLDDVASVCLKIKYSKAKDKAELAKFTEPAMFAQVKETLMMCERALLYTLNFQFRVEHPFNTSSKLLNDLGLSQDKSPSGILQLSTNFLNDFQRTTLCLQYPANKIGLASVWMAAKFTATRKKDPVRLPLPEGKAFYEVYPISLEELLDIERQGMAMYDQKSSSKPEEPGTLGAPSTPHLPEAAPSTVLNGTPDDPRNITAQSQPAQQQQVAPQPVQLPPATNGSRPLPANAARPLSEAQPSLEEGELPGAAGPPRSTIAAQGNGGILSNPSPTTAAPAARVSPPHPYAALHVARGQTPPPVSAPATAPANSYAVPTAGRATTPPAPAGPAPHAYAALFTARANTPPPVSAPAAAIPSYQADGGGNSSSRQTHAASSTGSYIPHSHHTTSGSAASQTLPHLNSHMRSAAGTTTNIPAQSHPSYLQPAQQPQVPLQAHFTGSGAPSMTGNAGAAAVPQPMSALPDLRQSAAAASGRTVHSANGVAAVVHPYAAASCGAAAPVLKRKRSGSLGSAEEGEVTDGFEVGAEDGQVTVKRQLVA